MNTQPNHISSTQQPLVASTSSYGIKSTNVMLEANEEPMEAIILIEGQKIFGIVIPSQIDSTTLTQINEKWTIMDYGELVIFPGLVDTNVHLHAGFSDEWENIEETTELAAAGGVTTIVDNPSLSAAYNTGEEYLETLKKRIELIREKSLVDFGVFGVLEPRTQDNVKEMLEAGALGMKTYLASSSQNTIKHYEREEFESVFEELEANHPELLLLVHPEMATDRELYLTSPCRKEPVATRLDMLYNIKSIEFGGAANKGSYIDDFSRKYNKDDDEESEEETEQKEGNNVKGTLGDIDSPSRFQDRIREVKEKTEINDLVHFELSSYAYDTQDNINDGDSTPDSDNEFLEKGSNDSGKIKFSTLTEMMEKQEEKQADKMKLPLESDEDEKDEHIDHHIMKLKEIGKKRSDARLSASPVRKSIFAKMEGKRFSDLATQDNQEGRAEENRPKQEQNEETQEKKFAIICSKQCSLDILAEKEEKEARVQLSLLPGLLRKIQETKSSPDFDSKEGKNATETNEISKLVSPQTHQDISEPLLLFNRRPNSPAKKFAPLITSWNNTNLDTRASLEYQETPEANTINPIDYKELRISLEQSPMTPQEDSPSNLKVPHLFQKIGTPANSSSLLQRRITLKSVNQVMTPVESAASTPLRRLSRFSSLEVVKTPESIEKRETTLNQSYRVFLANRPLNWEENAVSTVIENVKPETKLRIVIQNLSLASSFMKINMKNSEDNLKQKIISDASPAYFYFSDKMINKGETKYKVSPPLRNKENRKLLLEHFKMGAIDTISSYHFYVPQEYKQIDNGNFRRAFGGLNTMGCSLQAVWTSMYNSYQKNNIKFQDESPFRKHKINWILRQIYQTMCMNPAKLLKIENRKGSIMKGKDADFVIWDPYLVENSGQLGKQHIFAGKTLMGSVMKTYLRGSVIYDKNDATGIKRENVAEFIRL